MDVDDAGPRLDRGADPRIDPEAAGEREFDLAARQVENDSDPGATADFGRDRSLIHPIMISNDI